MSEQESNSVLNAISRDKWSKALAQLLRAHRASSLSTNKQSSAAVDYPTPQVFKVLADGLRSKEFPLFQFWIAILRLYKASKKHWPSEDPKLLINLLDSGAFISLCNSNTDAPRFDPFDYVEWPTPILDLTGPHQLIELAKEIDAPKWTISKLNGIGFRHSGRLNIDWDAWNLPNPFFETTLQIDKPNKRGRYVFLDQNLQQFEKTPRHLIATKAQFKKIQ